MENPVSKFLVGTCRIQRKFHLSRNAVTVVLRRMRYLVQNHVQFYITPTMCGSQAEFYIEPINPCIDDLDMVSVASCPLALDSNCEIPEGVGYFGDLISCCKLESHEQNASFVWLRDQTTGEYDWQLEKYTFQNKPTISFMPRDLFMSPTTFSSLSGLIAGLSDISGDIYTSFDRARDRITVRGPAMTATLPNCPTSLDIVFSMPCPKWPLVAEEWPKRRRNSGWPRQETINKVVREGCHVVSVTHRDMQEDLNQWRLSFSRAEVTLIQSWTKIQQIVYHLIRFFAKREIIRKNCPKKEEVLCTYHLKTLMLWSCEKESTEWWEASSVIAICCNLCGKLSDCLKHKHCPNYFIPKANLLDYELDLEVLQQTIKTLDDLSNAEEMSQWFATHYILPVYQKLFDENDTLLTKENIEICRDFVCENIEEMQLSYVNSGISLCAENCFNLNFREKYIGNILGIEIAIEFLSIDFSNLHKDIADYTKALILFKMSQSIMNSNLQLDVEYLYELWINILKRHYNFVEMSNYKQELGVENNSMLYFNRAEQIMKHSAFGYSQNESCFSRMVSMLCLHKSFSCHDISSYKTDTASRIYMAALFYYIGRLQCALNLCSDVIRNFKHNERCVEVRHLKVNCLLFMDDLAAVAGFLLLRRKVLRIQKKGIFLLSSELFAHYVLFQCSTERPNIDELFHMILPFAADRCLAAMMRYKMLRYFDSKIEEILIYDRCTEHTEEPTTAIVLPGSRDIAETMARISTDYMTRFYASLGEEFGPKFNLSSCYEALSLYLCHRYEDAIFLCERLLKEYDHDSQLEISEFDTNVEEFQFLNLNVSYFFMAYFDEDIQALVGFQLLLLKVSLLQSDVLENIDEDEILLSIYYKAYYETFRPILRKQFLGNYLKLRCLLEMEFPMFEVISAFQSLKCLFLFEHTLMHFMRQKIIRLGVTVPQLPGRIRLSFD